jgi:hypothetical protein
MATLFVYRTFPGGRGERNPLRSEETFRTPKTFKSNDGALEYASQLIRADEERQRNDPYSGQPLDKLEIECDDGARWGLCRGVSSG